MLHYQITGSGTACVFLHGFLESMAMWDYLTLNELKGKHVFIDLPGHGGSSLNDDNVPSIDFIAESIQTILIKEGIEEFNIVGHSMGGYVALSLKEKMPTCKKVILLNSNYWADSEEKKEDRDRVAKIAFRAKNYFLHEAIPNLFTNKEKFNSDIDRLIVEAKQMSAEAISYASIAMRNRRDMTFILNVNDFVIIHGELDPLVDQKKYDLRFIGKSHFHQIKSAGHMSHIENPGEVIDLLKLYLKD